MEAGNIDIRDLRVDYRQSNYEIEQNALPKKSDSAFGEEYKNDSILNSLKNQEPKQIDL